MQLIIVDDSMFFILFLGSVAHFQHLLKHIDLTSHKIYVADNYR